MSQDTRSNVIEMAGCSALDIDIARMFWKSFTLAPPLGNEKAE